MGMLECRIEKVPDGKTRSEYVHELNRKLDNYFSQSDNSCDNYEVEYLTEHNFEKIWKDQETYKNTPEIKQKYFNLAKAEKLVCVEIDW